MRARLRDLRYTLRTWHGLALWRVLWLRHIRGYAYEVCHDCGQPVSANAGGQPLTWWRADDQLWNRTVESPGVVLCISCFVHRSDEPVRIDVVPDTSECWPLDQGTALTVEMLGPLDELNAARTAEIINAERHQGGAEGKAPRREAA